MTKFLDPCAQFATDILALYPNLGLRAECESDKPFLFELFMACSPLTTVLPRIMLEQQAFLQDRGSKEEFPMASRWIVLRRGEPIGRIIIDWDYDGQSHCVDIALLPAEQGAGVGTALLKAWIAVSDRLKRDTSLQVLVDSRAKDLYQRIGFVITSTENEPSVTMVRSSGS